MHGLSLQGARWDDRCQCMVAPHTNDGLIPLPPIQLQPVTQSDQSPHAKRLVQGVVEHASTCGGGEVSVDSAERPGQQFLSRVAVFETELRGQDGPALLVVELPTACAKAVPVPVGLGGTHEASDWVLQSPAIVCSDVQGRTPR